MVEFLELRGIEGATVLEIGGGVGEIQIELLKRGAARSVNLELSPAYDEEAKRLLREAALDDRAERRLLRPERFARSSAISSPASEGGGCDEDVQGDLRA